MSAEREKAMRSPDVVGTVGRAWEVRVQKRETPPDWGGSLGTWILHVPWAHPAWSYYCLGVIHLRPIPGVRPAQIRVEGASHEFMIHAFDPDSPHSPPSPDISDETTWPSFLQPIDLAHQVVGLTDEQAARIGGLMVRMICDGRMSPDQDFRSVWRELLDGTAKHYREGRHPIS